MIKLDHNIHAATRKDAFQIIEQSMIHNQPLDRIESEKLYKYFMPKTKAKKAKSAIEWCSKAVANNKEIREYLKYMYSNGSRLYACNGAAMHVIDTDLDAGYYCPHTFNKVDLDATYPDIDRVTPNFKDVESFHIASAETAAINDKCITQKFKNITINQDFIKNASNGSDYIELAIDPETPNSSVYGKNEFGYFVIMPTRS